MKPRMLRLAILTTIIVLAAMLAENGTADVFQSIAYGPSQSRVVSGVQSLLVVNVTISNFAFSPQTLTLDQGQLVTWTNNDPVVYTLWFVNSSDNSTFALSPSLNPGGTYSLTFPSPGAIKYYSFERLWITGTISINQLPLAVSISVNPNPTVSNTGTAFSGSVSRGTSPYSYSWSFGDGSTGTGNIVSHAYSSGGTFIITLTATDASAAKQTVSSTVSVVSAGDGGGSGRRQVL